MEKGCNEKNKMVMAQGMLRMDESFSQCCWLGLCVDLNGEKEAEEKRWGENNSTALGSRAHAGYSSSRGFISLLGHC